jgi:hypothetical protein
MLRAHAECAAQAHGEKFVHENLSSSAHYDSARQSIESAIQSLSFAEQYIARAEVRKQEG